MSQLKITVKQGQKLIVSGKDRGVEVWFDGLLGIASPDAVAAVNVTSDNSRNIILKPGYELFVSASDRDNLYFMKIPDSFPRNRDKIDIFTISAAGIEEVSDANTCKRLWPEQEG